MMLNLVEKKTFSKEILNVLVYLKSLENNFKRSIELTRKKFVKVHTIADMKPTDKSF